MVYDAVNFIYRWYMLVHRSYTDGILPIYRWYIAHIPMVYRPYTNSPPQARKTIHVHSLYKRRQHEQHEQLFSCCLRRRQQSIHVYSRLIHAHSRCAAGKKNHSCLFVCHSCSFMLCRRQKTITSIRFIKEDNMNYRPREFR